MSMRYPAGFISAFYNPLKNPDAPTIGTATGGSGSASVAFTAPSNVGGSAITSYIAVSNPSGITASGTSSPISVTGLAADTAYTFKVFATNSYGPSALSASSNSATTLPAIGSALSGGFFAGQISTSGNSVATHNLIVGPIASAESNKLWKIVNTGTTGTSSVIDGPTNSSNMNNVTHPAAEFCEGLTIGGFSDWYLPAKNELEVCYYNLKPYTTNNDTGFGINANAVPARASNYTASVPAQTSSANFVVTTGAQSFGSTRYWSSTEYDADNTRAWTKFFSYGGVESPTYKSNYSGKVRAIRRVAV